MKISRIFFIGLFIFLVCVGVQAQNLTGADFFAGKWKVLVKGTPNGDAKMIVVFLKTGDQITGVVQDSTGNNEIKITSTTLKENEITFNFFAEGYDVYISLTKKDETHVSGSLMNMFDASGEKLTE